MEGQVTLSTTEYNGLVIGLEREKALNRRITSELCEIKTSLADLIDAEANSHLKSTKEYSRPYYLAIEDVAKTIGLDWTDYMSNWSAEHAKYVIKED